MGTEKPMHAAVEPLRARERLGRFGNDVCEDVRFDEGHRTAAAVDRIRHDVRISDRKEPEDVRAAIPRISSPPIGESGASEYPAYRVG
jgi:hypothetical protein